MHRLVHTGQCPGGPTVAFRQRSSHSGRHMCVPDSQHRHAVSCTIFCLSCTAAAAGACLTIVAAVTRVSLLRLSSCLHARPQRCFAVAVDNQVDMLSSTTFITAGRIFSSWGGASKSPEIVLVYYGASMQAHSITAHPWIALAPTAHIECQSCWWLCWCVFCGGMHLIEC